MSSRLGGFIAPLLIVWLFKASGDWKESLVLVAGLGLLWCLGSGPGFATSRRRCHRSMSKSGG